MKAEANLNCSGFEAASYSPARHEQLLPAERNCDADHRSAECHHH